MKISFEEKKAEAVKRMKMIGIYIPAIIQFDKENLVSVSEPPLGAFFWAGDDDMKRIREFEKKSGTLVYTVVRSYVQEYGRLDAYLFVSDYKDEEWEIDQNDLKNGQTLAYVYNAGEPFFSEFGLIGIELTIAGGLRRIW